MERWSFRIVWDKKHVYITTKKLSQANPRVGPKKGPLRTLLSVGQIYCIKQHCTAILRMHVQKDFGAERGEISAGSQLLPWTTEGTPHLTVSKTQLTFRFLRDVAPVPSGSHFENASCNSRREYSLIPFFVTVVGWDLSTSAILSKSCFTFVVREATVKKEPMAQENETDQRSERTTWAQALAHNT